MSNPECIKESENEATKVEVARLVFPRETLYGEGDELLIEGERTIIENIANTSTPSINPNHVEEETKSTFETDLSNNNAPQIQALVDLVELGEIVGISEQEILQGLQTDTLDLKEKENTAQEDERNNVNLDKNEEDSERGKLLPSFLMSSALAVNAEPFVATLAADTNRDKDDDDEATKSFRKSARTSSLKQSFKRLSQLKEPEEFLCKDAFLISLPPTDDNVTDEEKRFLLAVPEIEEKSFMATTNDATGDNLTYSLIDRAFSILPSDVQEISLEAKTVTVTEMVKDEEQQEMKTKTTEQIQLDLVVKRSVPLIGYVLLIAGLVALSSVGAAMQMQVGASPFMKTLWRLVSTAVVLIPLVIRAKLLGKGDFIPDQYNEKKISFFVTILMAALANVVMLVTFVVSLNMTSVANAFVFSNMTSLVIIAGKAVMGIPILLAEGAGAIIGFLGGVICAKAPEPITDNSGDLQLETFTESSSQNLSILGDVIAFSGSLAMAIYLIVAKNLRTSLDLHIFTFYITFFGSVFLIIYMVLTSEELTFSNDSLVGIWGWTKLSYDRLPLELYIAIICNLVGSMGFVAVMKYFDPVVVSTVMLMEPVVAIFIGLLLRIDTLPGLQTWMGDLVVSIGTFLVIYSGSKKTESIDATKALRTQPTELDVIKADDTFRKNSIILKSPAIIRSSTSKIVYGSLTEKA